MARVVYVGPSPSVDLLDGTACPHGEPVEVADDLAAALLEQDVWQAAKSPTTPPTTPKPNKPAEPEKAGEP